MQHVHFAAVIVALFLMIFVSACGGVSAQKEYEDFDPTNFDNPTQIVNKWFPLEPGIQNILEGTTVEEGESISHRVVFVVTDLTKVIAGVRSVVVWELDYSDDLLEESELAFYAQDNEGNIWQMGQYPEVYDEEGALIETPAWIHGIEDAVAGIVMKPDPQPGEPSYSQGWGPAVDWNDRAQVDQLGEQICVPMRCFEDVLVIIESSKSEPNAFQLKYYAAGVGTIRVSWRGEDETREELELVQAIHLSPEEIATIHAAALGLEESAYEHSEDVYGLSSPAK